MQNWNQWQVPPATVAASMPQPPIGYAAPGADPMATMQAYMQYYSQPAPSGYTAEQWATAQQQNWVQWQTWQQQYQQWQAQYGEKYQETMKQMSAQGLPGLPPVTTPIVLPPPLPKEDTSAKPPLPPGNNAYGFSGGLPSNVSKYSSQQSGNPPLPPGQPPLPTDNSQCSSNDGNPNGKRGANSNVDSGSAKKLKTDDEELTEAEKTFDAQFKQWEEQFNKWKQQNANHPDKTQYKQYEAKWTSWREKLIERREQMRKKREQQKQASAKADIEKNKGMTGDAKILNILSSTENQGLINNLLGIGKTLGLTGKQDIPGPPPGQPPAPPIPQGPQVPMSMGPPAMTANMNQAAWAAQQWASQFNPAMNMLNYGAGYQQATAVPPPGINALANPMQTSNLNQPSLQSSSIIPSGANFSQPPGNFNQSQGNLNQPPANYNQLPPGMSAGPPNVFNAPPNLSAGGPNFSQPPPAFGQSDRSRQQSSAGQEQRNPQDCNSQSFRNDGDQRSGRPFNRDSMGSGNNRFGYDSNCFNGPPPNDNSAMNRRGSFSSNDNYGRDGPNNDFASGNQRPTGSDNVLRDGTTFGSNSRSDNDFRSNDRFGYGNDRSGSGFDRDQGDRFDRGTDDNGRFGPTNDSFNPDRFNNSTDRFGPNSDRFRSGTGNDRLSMGNDRTGLGFDKFGSSNNRFGPGNDRFGTSNDRLGLGDDRLSLSNDRFSRPFSDRSDLRDGGRDSSGSNQRGFGTSNQSDAPNMPPELKKLMEKRRAAMDVFRPSQFSSLLDAEKNNSASTSLSESFRKLTGDSPFLSRSSNDFGNKDSFALRGSKPSVPGGFGNTDSSRDFRPGDNSDFNFRGPGDFRSRGPGDFNPRGAGNFPPRGNEFGLRGMEASGGSSRSDNMAPRMGSEFEPKMRNELRPGNEFGLSRKDNEQQRDNYRSYDNQGSTSENSDRILPSGISESTLQDVDDRQGADETSKLRPPGPNDPNSGPNQLNVPPLPMPPWMDPGFASDMTEKPTSLTSELPDGSSSNVDKTQDGSRIPGDSSSTSVNAEELNDSRKSQTSPPENSEKNSDVLPFMGENDPKPEDLNMEPPPELPNLGPITRAPRSPFEQRGGNMGGPLGPPSGDFSAGPSFDAPFSPRETQMASKGPMPLFGARGSNDNRFPPFGPRGMGGSPDNMRPPGPYGPNSGSFGPRGPQGDNFNPRGPSVGGFGPRGPGDFGPRGPSDFGPRGFTNFGPRDPNSNQFGPRGPSDRSFGPRGPFDNSFAPPGPNDGPFGSRGPNGGPFGPRGPNDAPFRPRGPENTFFGPRGPNDGPCGPNDGSFGSRGPPNDGPFGLRGPNNSLLPTPGRNDNPSGPCRPNDGPSGPRGPDDTVSGRLGLDDAPFAPPTDFGTNTFAPRGQFSTPKPSIPSLLSFKVEKPKLDDFNNMLPPKNDGFEANQSQDLPLAFRGDDQDLRPFVANETQSDAEKSGPNTSDHRGPGSNKFGDLDERTGSGDPSERPAIRPDDIIEIDRDRDIPCIDLEEDEPDFGAEERVLDREQQNLKSASEFPAAGSEEPSRGFGDQRRGATTNPTTALSDNTRGLSGGLRKEFCIEKQFNYNHGGGVPDEISKDHAPVKVIDYAHAPRVTVRDYVTPAQSFDYGHGSLKPNVPDHEIFSQQDFRHWEENEHNLKEYTDRMNVYESGLNRSQCRTPVRESNSPGKYKGPVWIQEERRSFDRDRRARNDRRRDVDSRRDVDNRRDVDSRRDRERDSRERGRVERDREWERISNKHREDRSRQRRSISRDRARDRSEKIRKESKTENNKDDERSKGNVSGQDSSAKKPAEATSQDNSKEEVKNVEPDESSKTTEPPKEPEQPQAADPPKTMELAKTPSFAMVDDLLCPPGRQNRPPKIVIILRGPPGSGKSFVAKLIKDKEVEQGGSAPRILSLDDYFLTEKEIETVDDNGKKVTTKEMVYEYEEAIESSYVTSLVKAFKKNITDGFFSFIILDSINEKISDYEEMWSFAKTKGFRVYVCEMEMDVQVCLKRNTHNRTEDEINRIVDYFEPTPSYHQKLDVTTMLQAAAIEEGGKADVLGTIYVGSTQNSVFNSQYAKEPKEPSLLRICVHKLRHFPHGVTKVGSHVVHMEDSEEAVKTTETPANDDSQDSQEDQDSAGISKWEKMEAEDKLDRLDGLAKKKNDSNPQTMEDFLQVPDYYNMEDSSGKRRVRWADLEERKEQEKMRAVGFVVGQTNWDRMMDPTKGGSALTRTKLFPPA